MHVRRDRHNQIGRPNPYKKRKMEGGEEEEKKSSSLLPSTLVSIKSITFIVFLFLVQSEIERKNTHTRKHESRATTQAKAQSKSKERKQPNVSKEKKCIICCVLTIYFVYFAFSLRSSHVAAAA